MGRFVKGHAEFPQPKVAMLDSLHARIRAVSGGRE
jgi:hypothetical protein